MNGKHLVIIFLVVVGLCVASFFIGKGYANSKCNYVEGLAGYAHSHCVMWDGSTDDSLHVIMNSSDFEYSYDAVCS